MGRIAVTEDVEGIRDEEEVIDEPPESPSPDEENAGSGDSLSTQDGKRKFIATVIEVQDAFDSCNTLRYSQPTHLQGKCLYT